jgi:hypothetical protein
MILTGTKLLKLLLFRRFCLFLFITLNFLAVWSQQAPEPPPGIMAGQPASLSGTNRNGLLFHLSGRQGFAADHAAGGQILPNFVRDVRVTENGPYWYAVEADDNQLLSYWAPGNIYAQRGTLSFFWRSRYPVGPTEFPVFRVGYADHSSWDMVWLRIDYNGAGFDAFVTDTGLSRTRVSHYMDRFPGPDEWTHIALSWDETEGIRLYINGLLAEKQTVSGKVYDSGLDQFGPHSRIISPYQVQSQYNFVRGGDLADLRIYDRMLSDDNILSLARGERPFPLPDLKRDLAVRRWRDAWWLRHGWNLPNDPPPVLASEYTSVRKVEIHEAIDIKRWYWKAGDGIRETTWPAAYNMSRLPGRFDYFVIPDWDCYSVSGQTIRFGVPGSEPWNHIEVWGTAWGQMTHESDHPYDHTFAVRHQHQVKSVHRLENEKTGGVIRFDNALMEEPIGSFMLYNVKEGKAPASLPSEVFTLEPAQLSFDNRSISHVSGFIAGRYPADERSMMVGVAGGETGYEKPDKRNDNAQPVIHIVLPYSHFHDMGLDGVEIELPAMDLIPTHRGVFPMNLRIKDPLWLMRDLADFSFSVEAGKKYTLWIDTRDRILPENRSLYMTLAGAGAGLTPEALRGARVRLVYKSKEEAIDEHIADRFMQVKDLHAHNVEENPRSPRLNSFNRFYADVNDLLRHDPEHWLARAYRYWVSRDPADRPEYQIPPGPEGVPEWAHLQIEHIKQLERIANYYIDERQISNGEFGGGLNDDGKFTFFFTPLAYFGVNPEKILKSMRLHMTAYYDQERDPYDAPLKQRTLPLFTNGLSTIQSDELHNYEDGIQMVGQMQLLDYGSPVHMIRGMETSRSLFNRVTAIAPDGHRRFRSRYFSGTRIAEEDPWQWSVPNSYIIMHPAFLVARYNGNPLVQQMITELADGLLQTAVEGEVYTDVHFRTGQTREFPRLGSAWMIMQAAWDYTSDEKYLKHTEGRIETSREFDPEKLAEHYKERIREMEVREYISTEGSIWIDRVPVRSTGWLQNHRLGGVAVESASNCYPHHRVSWQFQKPASYESLAVFIPEGDDKKIDIIAYNLDNQITQAKMTVWEVIPGRWRIRQGIDTNGDLQIDSYYSERIVELIRGEAIQLAFEPREYSIINMELIEPAAKGYRERADLAICINDIRIDDNEIRLRVHNLGGVGSGETSLEIRDASQEIVALQKIPAIEAPLDLIPRWHDIVVTVPEGTDLSSGSAVVDPNNRVLQITRINSIVKW